jgi:hypothetical protein
MDADAAGIEATKKALEGGLLEPADYTLVTCPGLKESELEDLIDSATYVDAIRKRWNVDLAVPSFRNGKAKWTTRVAATFKAQGKVWDDLTEKRVKEAVAQTVAGGSATALHSKRRGSFDSLVSALEERLATYAD